LKNIPFPALGLLGQKGAAGRAADVAVPVLSAA
jgi:hypothetical protein